VTKGKIKCRTCIHDGERGWDGWCFNCVYPDALDKDQYELYEPIFDLSDEYCCDYCAGKVGDDGVCQKCGAKYRTAKLEKSDGSSVSVGVIREKDHQASVLAASFIVTKHQAKIFEDNAENYAKQHIIKQIAELLADNDLVEIVKSKPPELEEGSTVYTGYLRALDPNFKFGEE